MLNKLKQLSLTGGMILLLSNITPQIGCASTAFTVALQDSITILKKQITRYPDSLALHQRFLEATDSESTDIEKLYQKWSKKNTKSAVIPFAYGEALMQRYSHKSEYWLKEATNRDPLYAEAWYQLSLYADFSGDKSKSNDYLRRAVDADPNNANYAFYFSSRDRKDMKSYENSTLEFISKFPRHQRAAQALYWLANRTSDQSKKIQIYERTLAEYSPADYSWAAASMSEYFNLLLELDPKRAADLANRLKSTSTEQTLQYWTNNVELAEQILKIKALINEKKGKEAEELIKKMKPQRGSAGLMITSLSFEAIAANGNTQAAYDSVLTTTAQSPTPIYLNILNQYGERLNKSKDAIDNDLKAMVKKKAVKATPFTLEQYLESGTLSLDDLKGKIVLLTYWYPGCGPCRAEFPHFENVLSKFNRDNVVYLGINIVRKQDDFVKPFMEESKNTFVPLKEIDGRDKGNLDNRGVAPMNFLIDKDGNIAFSRFMIGANNEAMLENMISLLL